MLALPRGGTLRADYSLIALYDSICTQKCQYAHRIVALGKLRRPPLRAKRVDTYGFYPL